MRSVAATVALPGDGRPSTQRVEVHVGAGARLAWLPEPLVAAAGSDHTAVATAHLAADAQLGWLDEVVLGRHGEPAGALTSTLRIERHTPDGPVALLHHGLDTRLPGWSSAPVTAGHRVSALCAVVGVPLRSPRPVPAVAVATSQLATDVTALVALAPDHASLRLALADLDRR